MNITETFSSLKVFNFRLFAIGQGLSLIGTWMQNIGLTFLVLKISHSGTQLGLVLAFQFLPILLFGMYGGLIADSFNKRHILLITQSLFCLLALLLGGIVLTNKISIDLIYLFSVLFGLVNAVDNATRQSFVIEMVGGDNLKNAVTLNSTIVNIARIIGPSIAGILIASTGIADCFIVNGFSYILVIIALIAMHTNELYPAKIQKKADKQIRLGIQYVLNQAKLKAILIMMFIIGTFTFEFTVILPLLAVKTFHGNSSTYAFMMTIFGVGAVIGGIYSAGHSKTNNSTLLLSALLFGVTVVIASFMPSLIAINFVLFFVGITSVIFISLGNTLLQLESDQKMRGRVMSLWSIAFLGTTPIGGPIIGWISDNFNPRIGLMTGGIAAILASYVGYIILKPDHKNIRNK